MFLEHLGLHKQAGTEVAHAPIADGLDSNQALSITKLEELCIT